MISMQQLNPFQKVEYFRLGSSGNIEYRVEYKVVQLTIIAGK